MSLIPAGLTGILGKLSPILKLLGIDPAVTANRMGREQVKVRLSAAAPSVVARLERDKMTPAAKGDGPAAERQVIRSAMYLLFKECFKKIVPGGKGSNVLADAARDIWDDKTVVLVAPLITASTTTEDLVKIVSEQLVELIF